VDSLAEPNVEPEETEPGRVEFSFPMLTIRTKFFSGVFDRLGRLRISRWASWISMVIVPVVAAIGLYLIGNSLIQILWTPEVRQLTRDLGITSYLLLPGINPILPIFYGWLAIVCAIVIHEGAHGIIARNRGFNVKSSGLLFFLIIPIGAFVDVDEDQIEKSKPNDSLRVMAGGVAGNTLIAVISLIALLLLVNGLTPVVNGVYISEVIEGLPADQAGLLPADVFVSIDGVPIGNYEEDLKPLFENKNPGDTVYVTVSRGENWNEQYSTPITLIESNGTAVMGITLGDLLTEERIDFYGTVTLDTITLYMLPPSLAPSIVPFSDSLSQFYIHPIGANWQVYANIFYWLWFVNLNVAIFNALPIYPLDGGRILDISLKSVLAGKASEKTISRITRIVTAVLISVLLMSVIIPFVM